MLSRNGLNLSLSLSTLSVVLIQSVDYGSRSSDSCCYGAAYSAIQHCVPGGTFMHHNTYSLHPWIISQHRFSNMIPRVLYSSLSLIMLVQLNTVRQGTQNNYYGNEISPIGLVLNFSIYPILLSTHKICTFLYCTCMRTRTNQY